MVPPSKPTTLIVGGTPKQRDVLEEILSGLGPTRLESVEIVTDLDKDWGAPPDAVGYGAKTPHGEGYGHWQGEIAGEVFARRSVQLGLPAVAYIADESSASAPGASDNVQLSEPPLTQDEAVAALKKVISTAKEHGASAEARVLKPNRLAIAITFRTDAPARFLLRGLEPSLTPVTDLDWRRLDGLYVKVVDAKGAFVLESGAGYSVRPDLEGCSPYLTIGGTLTPQPPPCPVEDQSVTPPR
jgi:hypothetical protein